MCVLAQYSGANQRALNLKWDGLNKEVYIGKGLLAKKSAKKLGRKTKAMFI
jgi:hypothetical protein